jgi:hypothetical protein
MSSNEKTISFRALAKKIEALDSLAAAQERPRSYLINGRHQRGLHACRTRWFARDWKNAERAAS